MKLILASSSERRRELLSWLGVPFEVVVSELDESQIQADDPGSLVSRLAVEKAKAVAKDLNDGLVIGADTIVYIGGEIIGKPKDEKDAVRILRKLSGNTHWVYTGVAVVDASSGKNSVDVEKTAVTFREIPEGEIQAYVDSGEPLDKAGGYAIQMGAAGFVEKVEGSYTNVVGLPLLTLAELLEKQGYSVKKDVSKIVFKKTGYWS
ncbi:septum formation inhibitor Maf [Patescibacteria group bacterium]|nr:septum formation inhibitor Maf [Patescibacteria group bacterium]